MASQVNVEHCGKMTWSYGLTTAVMSFSGGSAAPSGLVLRACGFATGREQIPRALESFCI